MTKECKLVQYADQMTCATCGQIWDMNDLYPPDCTFAKKKGLFARFMEWLRK